jgi:hypothetical protein
MGTALHKLVIYGIDLAPIPHQTWMLNHHASNPLSELI